MTASGFIPAGFSPPPGLDSPSFALEPLGPEHNERDHAAWSSSIEHIRATPGFIDRGWPRPMTLAENLGDLRRHASDFAAREGFTYTVLEPTTRDVIGCVYIYPRADSSGVAEVSSWVRVSHAHLDGPLHDAVRGWLASSWPFGEVDYADRPPGG